MFGRWVVPGPLGLVFWKMGASVAVSRSKGFSPLPAVFPSKAGGFCFTWVPRSVADPLAFEGGDTGNADNNQDPRRRPNREWTATGSVLRRAVQFRNLGSK